MNGYGRGRHDPQWDASPDDVAPPPSNGDVLGRLRKELGVDGEVAVTVGEYSGTDKQMIPVNELKSSFRKPR